MNHDGDQFEGYSKPGAKWNNMTDEDMIEYERYLEKEAKHTNGKNLGSSADSGE